MRHKHAYLALAMTLLVLTVVIAFALKRPVKPEESLRIGYMRVTTGLPLFVAKDRDLFSKHGVKVDLQPFETVNQAVDALLAGRIDSIQGVGLPTLLAAHERSSGMFKFDWLCYETETIFASAVLKSKNSSISTMADLKGKTVGTYSGTTQLLNLRVILRANGLDPDKDVTIRQVARTIELTALSSGSLDALFTIEPTIAIAKSKNLAEILVDNPRVRFLLNPFPAGGAVIAVATVQKRPAEIRKFRAAIDEAIEIVASQPKDIMTSIDLPPRFVPKSMSVVC